MHPYFLEQRAQAHWQALHRMALAARPVEVPVRVRLGTRLVDLGHRVAGRPSLTTIDLRTPDLRTPDLACCAA